MPSNDECLAPGTSVGTFRIDRVLGQGGFGITYAATDVHLQRHVAVKEFFPQRFAVRLGGQRVGAATPSKQDAFFEWLRRFTQEAQTLAQFRHPNIVRVLQVINANGTAYLAMEYEKGESLQTRLHPRKTLSEPELTIILSPLLDGIEKIHEAGFIHRDIKPDNIMVRKDGTPVLVDFGAAREFHADRPLTAIATPGYAPIEQINAGQQGPWTDVYALGSTLYRCVAGRRPDDARRRHQVPDNTTPTASEIGAGRYSAAFLSAIDRAMDREPAKRPQSIAEFRQLLTGASTEALLDDSPREKTVPVQSKEGTTIAPPEPPSKSGSFIHRIQTIAANFASGQRDSRGRDQVDATNGPVRGTTGARNAAKPTATPDLPTEHAETNAPCITIDRFFETEFRVAQVISVNRVAGSDKLFALTVDLGTERRQILAGLAKTYDPEQLVGKRVVVVANLRPARIRGVESNGMLLAADDIDGRPIVVSFDEPVPPGTLVR